MKRSEEQPHPNPLPAKAGQALKEREYSPSPSERRRVKGIRCLSGNFILIQYSSMKMQVNSLRNYLYTFISWISFTICLIANLSLRMPLSKPLPSLPIRILDPNPVPPWRSMQWCSFLSVFCFDGYTDKGINRDWKAVTLENDYIKYPIFGVGGKVWGAIEKSTGGEFVYLNKVLKFRAIGIRGPWTSGGIEHNFGLDLGHAPWTSSTLTILRWRIRMAV